MHTETLGVYEELRNILDFFEPDASEKLIRLTLENEPAVAALTIMAEPILFQRAIGNLVSNAIRYTPIGGKVTVAYRQNESQVDIDVSDTGTGIATEHLEKIFERFYRVDHSRSIHSGGFGLGLAIVKSILHVHRGKVTAFSQVAKGTKIRTEWPVC